MKKKKWWLLVVILVLFIPVYGQVKEIKASEFKEDNLLSLVREASMSQISLSEEPQSKKQIHKKLSHYFTSDLTDHFIQENVYEVEGGFVTFGSDFAPYYVPFFQYDDTTKTGYSKGKWYVWEERSAEEGPYSTPGGIEAVVVTEEEGSWKVSEIIYELPEDILSP
ncbi:DUF3993 domain-containing protein [Bacillus sp. KH172YL63]|uniref:DUF3993 domain-containing protein n=1 Tax=Bacillus sp. KH172YL63 TaxID=2709784 RepID=UPI0013E44CD1|nr:DUF3993 domain-containing protein [Bacillus sp. KH172YL63]BCB03166.1 hypothetical protein KH172YL63_12990 [Bacillus sp. KH172YL63]